MELRPKFSITNTLSGRLLKVIFSLYCVVTLIVTFVHMTLEYRHTKFSINEELGTYQQLLSPLLKETITLRSKRGTYEVQRVLDAAVESDIISGVVVHGTDGRYWASGQWRSEAPATLHRYNFRLHSDRGESLADISLYSPATDVLHHLVYSFGYIVMGAMVKTAALWMLFFWAGYRYLSRPLWALTRATQKIQSGQFDKVSVSRKTHKMTEIDLLEQGFNTMVDELGATRRRLERTQERLADIINAMPTAIICVDIDGIVFDWNDTASSLSGVCQEQALGKSLTEVYPPFAVYLRCVNKAITEEQEQKQTILMKNNDGEDRYFDILVYPLVSDDFKGAVIRLDDVSMRVHLEKSVIQSEKLSSIGSLAAGMAHEINNPLGIILQGAQNIQRRLDASLPANVSVAQGMNLNLYTMTQYLESRKILSFLEGIRESGERASNIVANLLQFSRRTNTNHIPSSIVDIVNKAIELARVDYSLEKQTDFRKVDIQIHYEDELPLVYVCPMEIEQVILNILKNASHAMKDVGRAPRIEINLHIEDAKLQIDITDNGRGIPEHLLKRIFEPFYTTKPVGEGTGLGLSVSYGIIVESHHGEMLVASKEDVGTTFTIRLPLSGHHNA